jgi:serine/threonine protein kinase
VRHRQKGGIDRVLCAVRGGGVPVPDGAMLDRTISHYQLVEKIGEGDMGVVYKGRDTRLNRLVGIKILPAASPAP